MAAIQWCATLWQLVPLTQKKCEKGAKQVFLNELRQSGWTEMSDSDEWRNRSDLLNAENATNFGWQMLRLTEKSVHKNSDRFGRLMNARVLPGGERVLLHQFRDGEWRKVVTSVCVDKKPFAEGSMRLAFRGQLLIDGTDLEVVFKFAKSPDANRLSYFKGFDEHLMNIWQLTNWVTFWCLPLQMLKCRRWQRNTHRLWIGRR